LVRVSRAHASIAALPQGPATLEGLIGRFLAEPDDLSRADALGRALLPDGVVLPTTTPIYIVPDRRLRRVPFAALARGGHRLLDQQVFSYVPSLGVLRRMLAEPRRASGAAVVLGDPRGDLASAAGEAVAVAKRLGVVA